MTLDKAAQVAYEASSTIGRVLFADGDEDLHPWWLLNDDEKRKHVSKVRIIRESNKEEIKEHIEGTTNVIEKLRRSVFVTVALETEGL